MALRYPAGETLATLDYAVGLRGRASAWRWIVAVLVGALIGFGLSVITYEPLVRTFAQGRQLYVFDVSEPFEHQARFSFAFALAGAALGVSAITAARLTGRLTLTWWASAFTVCFFVAATVAFVVARNTWNHAVASPATSFPGPSLASVPLVAPMVIGTVTVVISLLLSVLWCRSTGSTRS
jgi:hypothetical protein